MRSPTGLVLDEPPEWSILDVARPITDLQGIRREADWAAGGINLQYRSQTAIRRRMPLAFTGTADPLIATVADPAAWPDTLTPDPAVTGPITDTLKAIGAEPSVAAFRPLFVHTPMILAELYQQLDDPETEAAKLLAAHVGRAISDEWVDSQFTKNPGLSLTVARAEAVAAGSADVSATGGVAVPATVALSTLYQADAEEGGNGVCTLYVPVDAVGFMIRAGVAGWYEVAGERRLLDAYGNPVHKLFNQQGPLADPDDLDSAPAPAAGEGWLWLSPRVYVGVAEPRPLFEGGTRLGRMGTYSERTNEQIGFAEVPVLVCAPPIRTFCCNTALNIFVGA